MYTRKPIFTFGTYGILVEWSKSAAKEIEVDNEYMYSCYHFPKIVEITIDLDLDLGQFEESEFR